MSKTLVAYLRLQKSKKFYIFKLHIELSHHQIISKTTLYLFLTLSINSSIAFVFCTDQLTTTIFKSEKFSLKYLKTSLKAFSQKYFNHDFLVHQFFR